MSPSKIQVAGDLCIDVIGVPQPRPSIGSDPSLKNWQLTQEIQTHYLRGGALLLADLVSAAVDDAQVYGPTLQVPEALQCGGKGGPLDESLFVRLTREEIVHSVLRVDECKAAPKNEKDSKKKTMRVVQTEGFAGPAHGNPLIDVALEEPGGVDIVVLDDTGNSFRGIEQQWPAAIRNPGSSGAPLIVHKMHRPIPESNEESKALAGKDTPNPAGFSLLWDKVVKHYPERRIVVITVDDLRNQEVPISRGLSWERTALEVIWHLINEPRMRELKRTPHLIIRLGLDGAIYWRGNSKDDDSTYKAWLVYDPKSIEGDWENLFERQMVAYGSAFTAGLVKVLAQQSDLNLLASQKYENEERLLLNLMTASIRAGMRASRRLLFLGFQTNGDCLAYPGKQLFEEEIDGLKEEALACQPIPIIPGAAVPDRGYWRLIDTIFSGKTDMLHRAVGLVAKGARIKSKKDGKSDEQAQFLLDQVPLAVFAGALRAYDRREIESYRSLYSLISNYIKTNPERVKHPLCVAVFGPPGAGKSFGVKMVAKELGEGSARKIDTLTFNLSQYENPEQLASAFHEVRDVVLCGRIPLVFFDEFDTALDGKALGWLRCFLSPMQDAEFLDRGTPHPIGQSIFIFAGGTKRSYAEFAEPFTADAQDDEAKKKKEDFSGAKGPDFLSRLRGTLDIPGLELNPDFDPYGPTESFPCEAAIMLRRANILAFQLGEKAPTLQDASKAFEVSDSVVRALIHLPRFAHGNRSFEALLEMSSLVDQKRFTPSLLPCLGQLGLHVNPEQFVQLLSADYSDQRLAIARAIHQAYLDEQKKKGKWDPNKASHQDWKGLSEYYRDQNLRQADHLAAKLQAVGLWFRKPGPGVPQKVKEGMSKKAKAILTQNEDKLARMEHDRWVAEQRRAGWIAGPDTTIDSRDNSFLLHNCIFPWEDIPKDIQGYDITTVRNIPEYLSLAGYELFVP
jgi:hypothetical protein